VDGALVRAADEGEPGADREVDGAVDLLVERWVACEKKEQPGA
jgi:hypothetical protein